MHNSKFLSSVVEYNAKMHHNHGRYSHLKIAFGLRRGKQY